MGFPIDAVGEVHWCCAVKTPEDEGRQLESDPLRNPKPVVDLSDMWRHVIVLLVLGTATEYYPSSGMEDGLRAGSPASVALA